MTIKNIIRTFASVALAMSFTACADQDYTEFDKGSDVLAIKADKESIVLDEVNHAETAVSIDWSTGNNGGTGHKIYYTLDLREKGGSHTAQPVFETIQTQQYTYSVESLNSLLTNEWEITAGESVTIEATVTASGEGFEPQTATTEFTATAYEPVTSTLYIVGSAAPNGWNADNAAEMKRTDNGVFTWEGNLNQGEIKFLTTQGQWLPCYCRGGSDTEMTLRTSDDQPDEKWNITEQHYYKISVNLLNLTISIQQQEGELPRFENLYLIGNETGWGFWHMDRDILDPFLFRIGVDFQQGGEFKFGTADGSWENNFKATVDNADYTDQRMEFVGGFDPDHKWNLQSSQLGAYKICVDIRTGKERMMMTPFQPYETIYLVGDATANGWDLGNATPMERESAFVQTWTGRLTAGELKFSCDKRSDWMGAWFLASTGDAAPTGSTERMLFVDKSNDDFKAQYRDHNVGDIDQKWRISEAGTYTITLDQLHETVTISKN